jgi:hypothetical protein
VKLRKVHLEWHDEMSPGAFPVCGTQAMTDRPVLSRDLAKVTCVSCLRILRQTLAAEIETRSATAEP